MYQIKSFRQCQAAVGRQACGRPSRRALQATCLHKALRTPSAGPITAPADVVYECLTLLRRPDLESLAPFFPPASYDPRVRRVGLVVGGEVVEEAGPLACCHAFMDTAARRVLPGHLLRRCRVLSSVQLPGGTCQLRVALTARTGEEAVFVWRLRRSAPASTSQAPGDGDHQAQATKAPAAAPAAAQDASGPSHGSVDRDNVRGGGQRAAHQPPQQRQPDQLADANADAEPGLGYGPGGWDLPGPSSSSSNSSSNSSSSSSSAIEMTSADGGDGGFNAVATGAGDRPRLGSRSGGGGGGGGAAAAVAAEPPAAATAAEPPDLRGRPAGVLTAWVVESIRRDDSHDEEEMPAPGPAGRGPHPRCSPEQVVKAQLAALRRGDVAGAASYNVWSRSTSGGWDLHLSAFRAMLWQPSYHVLLTSYDAELGPSALPSMRRMVQEVRLLTSPSPQGGGGGSGGGVYGSGDVYGSGGDGGSSLVFGLCMQANGCWLVEGIRAVH